MGGSFARDVEGGVLLLVHVEPGSSRPGLAGVRGGRLELRVRAPAIGGKANEAARELLAELLGVSPSCVALVKGATTRSKSFLVRGASAQALCRRLHVAEGG